MSDLQGLGDMLHGWCERFDRAVDGVIKREPPRNRLADYEFSIFGGDGLFAPDDDAEWVEPGPIELGPDATLYDICRIEAALARRLTREQIE